MPGMSTGLNANNPTIVSAFYNELLRQGLVVAVIVMLVGVAWSISRSAQLRRAALGQRGLAAHSAFRFRSPRPRPGGYLGSPSASSGSSTASSRARRRCLSAWPLK